LALPIDPSPGDFLTLTYGLLPFTATTHTSFRACNQKGTSRAYWRNEVPPSIVVFCIQKSVLQYEQEGTAHLAVNYLEEVPVERSYARQICCMLRRWPSWTYEGNRGCQASGFVQFPFKNGIRILQMPRTNAWPVPLGKIL
jgi:hypothetical protein